MTNTKYTTLEQSQKLKEIGVEAEADSAWNKHLRNCKQCNKDIAHRPPHAIYCENPLCARIHRRSYQPTLKCLNCNKDYKPLPYRYGAKFCTVSCSTKYAAKMRTNGQSKDCIEA